jgi:hypothetical protein
VLEPADKKKGTPIMMTAHTFGQLAATNPELQLRWKDGVEIEMKNTDFTTATIDGLLAAFSSGENWL